MKFFVLFISGSVSSRVSFFSSVFPFSEFSFGSLGTSCGVVGLYSETTSSFWLLTGDECYLDRYFFLGIKIFLTNSPYFSLVSSCFFLLYYYNCFSYFFLFSSSSSLSTQILLGYFIGAFCCIFMDPALSLCYLFVICLSLL